MARAKKSQIVVNATVWHTNLAKNGIRAKEVPLTENAARQQQAEREAVKAEAALARVERDYLDGKLSAEKLERLETRLLSERDGARAEARQHNRLARGN